jgi:hypothetical protein
MCTNSRTSWAVLVRGSLHWPPQKQDHPYVYLIQVFNTVSEVFRVVFPPPM